MMAIQSDKENIKLFPRLFWELIGLLLLSGSSKIIQATLIFHFFLSYQ